MGRDPGHTGGPGRPALRGRRTACDARPRMRGRTARIGAAAVLFGALALVPASIAGGNGDPSRTTAACRDFGGPSWTYTDGPSPKAAVYRGTRYHYATVRVSCSSAQRLIR